MKFWKKFLFLVLIIGVLVGTVRGVREIGGARLRPAKPNFGEAREEQIKFAVMSDIHSDWKNFRKAIKKVREIGDFRDVGGFVIITGDLTTLGKKSELIEAKKILDESGLKYFVIPGNHDIWWGRKYKEDIWGEVFGNSFQSFKIGGRKFILINNGDATGGLEGLGETGGQDPWIRRETEECLKIYCLVFMHMPLSHPNSLHVMGEENPAVASEAAELVGLLVKNRIKEVFAGHLHFSSSYELGGLKTTIVGAVTSERNFQSPKFLEISLKDGRIENLEVFVSN